MAIPEGYTKPPPIETARAIGWCSIVLGALCVGAGLLRIYDTGSGGYGADVYVVWALRGIAWIIVGSALALLGSASLLVAAIRAAGKLSQVALGIVATIALAALASGCGIVAVSPYASEQDKVNFREECAKYDLAEVKAAEQASGVAALGIGMGRFECARPRVWYRVKGDPATRAPEEALLDTGPVPTPEPAASPEEIARHRAEVDDLNRWLRDQGLQPGMPKR